MAATARSGWHLARAVARMQPVEAMLAEYASSASSL
jgi:hypothetical protein